jgi:putative phage tail fibre protein (fragment)
VSKKNRYKRTHQFTPYTKADGAAVSDEFDAIQAVLDLIPELRDDGKGFSASPVIPDPTEPNHPVPYSMLTETEKSVNNARDEVLEKAQQVAKNTETVATNTKTAINQANSATQSATSAAESSRSADESEDWARKWASNPVDEAVSGDKYSAYHYATKAEQSARSLSTAASAAENSANIAAQKAEEAKTYSDKTASAAIGEIDYNKVRNVPRASTTQDGVTRLTSDTGLDSETLGLTAKAGKFLAQGIAALRLALNNYIPLNKRSSAVNSNSNENVATSAAVKTAYDKAVNAENLANTKWTAKPATETEAGILPISHKTDGTSKEKFASEYAVGEAAKKGLPLGSIVSFPRAIANPVGFLKADGSTFSQQAFPDLYRALGNSNKLPDLTRSDVGMTAYFAVDEIPNGWIAFDDISTQVTQQRYPELYRHLIAKYGSISAVPKAADRFIRNAGNGLEIGQTQDDAIRNITGKLDGSHLPIGSQVLEGKMIATGAISTTYANRTWSNDSGGVGEQSVSFDFDASRVVPTADENRPKSLVLKLCIKAVNAFDDIVFWIKSHGDVTNAGALDASRLAQDLQEVKSNVQKIEEQLNQNQQSDQQNIRQIKQQVEQLKNKQKTTRKIWQGNVTNGSSVLTLSESITNKNLVFYLQSSSGHTLGSNDVNTVSCYIDNTIQDVGRSRFAYAAYWDGGWRNLKIEIVNEKQIKLVDSSGYYLKAITVSD